MKFLRQIVEAVNRDSFKPQAEGEKEFADQHKVNTIADRNGNGDDVFKATKVKTFTRKSNRFGNEPINQDGNVHKKNKLQIGVKQVSEITSKEWEDSEEDKRVDKKNGFKDGTKKDREADSKMVKAINKAEKKVSEDVEQVDELSKSLLKSYVKKAVKDVASRSDKAGHDAGSTSAKKPKEVVAKNKFKLKQRKEGVNKAVDKLSESVEESVSPDRMKLATRNKEERKDQKDWDGSKTFSEREPEKKKTEYKPKTTASDVVRKFRDKVKEEVEQVDEISTKTLTSYSRKASKDFDNSSDEREDMKSNGEDTSDLDRKINNRDKGIELAQNKIGDSKRIISKPKTKVAATEAISQIANQSLLITEIDSSRPENREIGTDSLVNILKTETPGEGSKVEDKSTPKKKSISELTEELSKVTF